MFDRLREDIAAVKERDPAATSTLSACCSTTRASRRSGRTGARTGCYTHGHAFLARCISQWARLAPGIEIHPGRHDRRAASSSTTAWASSSARRPIIGDDVTLYQGVTLGGTGKETRQAPPDARGLRRRRRRRDGARQHHRRPRQQGRRRRGRRRTTCPPNCTVVGVPGRVVVREGAARRGRRPAPRGPARPGRRDVPLPAAPHRPARARGCRRDEARARGRCRRTPRATPRARSLEFDGWTGEI